MKRTLNEAQFTELRKLGYMKDDSLAGLIEFLGEHTNGIYSYPVSEHDGEKYLQSKYINGNNIEELCDWLYESALETLKELKDKKHES